MEVEVEIMADNNDRNGREKKTKLIGNSEMRRRRREYKNARYDEHDSTKYDGKGREGSAAYRTNFAFSSK